MNINNSYSPIYVKVDLAAFRHNLGEVKKFLSADTKIMTLVKADACGHSADVLGRASMDHTMIDMTHIPGVSLHDEVVLTGSQGKDKITAEDIVDMTGTIGYEVLISISPGVYRVYIS